MSIVHEDFDKSVWGSFSTEHMFVNIKGVPRQLVNSLKCLLP